MPWGNATFPHFQMINDCEYTTCFKIPATYLKITCELVRVARKRPVLKKQKKPQKNGDRKLWDGPGTAHAFHQDLTTNFHISVQ